MTSIRVTASTMAALRDGKHPDGKRWVGVAKRNADGTWTIPVDRATLDRLKRLKLPGESDSAYVERAVDEHDRKTKKRNDVIEDMAILDRRIKEFPFEPSSLREVRLCALNGQGSTVAMMPPPTNEALVGTERLKNPFDGALNLAALQLGVGGVDPSNFDRAALREMRKAVPGKQQKNADAARRVLEALCTGELRLESPQVSRMGEFFAALLAPSLKETDPKTVDLERLREAQSLLIQHDWARLVSPSPEFVAGEWALPYDTCLFEMKISGHRVGALVFTCGEDPPHAAIGIRAPKDAKPVGWIFDTGLFEFGASTWRETKEPYVHGKVKRLMDLIFTQIKACCIVLDAEVAVTEPQRKPHRSNQPASKEFPPLPRESYHVVSLAHRSRVAALPRTDDEPRGRKRRLHFMRGHWRHYPSHKTWIKWQLRGDPDLGFVDKEYRL